MRNYGKCALDEMSFFLFVTRWQCSNTRKEIKTELRMLIFKVNQYKSFIRQSFSELEFELDQVKLSKYRNGQCKLGIKFIFNFRFTYEISSATNKKKLE